MTKTLSWVTAALFAAAIVPATAGNRHVTANDKSPATSTSVKLGGHEVSIEYSAPSARGRKVEGGLIPYGSVWRAGADEATTLSNDADIMLGSLRVPKGVHTLYVLGGEGDWKLIVNKQTGQWGTEYNEGQDLGRVDMKLTPLSAPVEKLKFELKPSALEMSWGKTMASVPLKPAR